MKIDQPAHSYAHASPGLPAASGKARQRLFLAMLMIIYALNFVDRQILVILQESIKQEYKLSDWQLGLLTGGAVSFLYTVMGVPIARWVDRGLNRVRLIAIITALWSIMTAVCGLTHTYTQILVARMGVGLAEAGYTPAAHSLIADSYDKRHRPAAMGIFALGVPLGTMLGLSLGGAVAHQYGWRMALMVVGLPGVVVALIFWAIAREPVRGAADVAVTSDAPAAGQLAPLPFWEAVKALFSIPAYVHILVASTATSFATTGITSWLPSLLIRAHGMSMVDVGIGLGAIAGGAGFLGALLGGWQATRLSSRGLHATMWIPTAGLVLAIPLFISAILFGTRSTTLWMLLVPMTLSTLWSAPSVALKQTLAPIRLRATASALSVVAANLLGVALGPIVAGALSDLFGRTTGDPAMGLRWALVAMTGSLVVGIIHWLLVIRALRRSEGKTPAQPSLA